MVYNCGHNGCDICGAQDCRREFPPRLRKYGIFIVCDSCLESCIKFAYEAACRFGGTIIDVHRPCGLKPQPQQ